MANPTPPDGVTAVPSTWSCRGEMYWILTSTGGKQVEFTTTSKTNPDDSYAPFESTLWSGLEGGLGKNIEGPGMIQITRFSETPIGPYNELTFMPGLYSVPSKQHEGRKDKYLRVARIYVGGENATNARATCWNGRRSFGVPKHLAAFEFTSDSTNNPNVLSVEVYPPTSEENPAKLPGSSPFFSAKLSKMPYFPISVPLSTSKLSWLGLTDRLVQPPLPASTSESGVSVLCGTDGWINTKLDFESVNGARFCWAEVGKQRRERSEREPLLSSASGQQQGSKDPVEVESEGWWPDTHSMAWRVGLWLGETTFKFSDVFEFEKLASKL